MDGVTRLFTRRDGRLLLRRERTHDGVLLVAVESGRARTFPFTDTERLSAFQADMEAFLLRTGWTLVDGAADPAPEPAPAPAETVGPVEEPVPALRLTLV
jgi:hypothetical protein